jgi:hypothetical protein
MNIYSKVMNGKDIERIRKREDFEKKQITNRILNILTNTPKELTPEQKRKLSKLYLEDYQLMCESMDFRKITARLLEVPIGKLTAICKSANGVIKQIDSSMATLKDKRQAKTSPIQDVNPEFFRAKKTRSSGKRITIQDVLDIQDLKLKIGDDIKAKIGYKLYDWVIEDKLDPISLSKNYYAIDYLKRAPHLINYRSLSANTNEKAIELLRKRIEEDPNSIDWDKLSKNQSAMQLIEEQLLKDKSLSIQRIRWDAFLCNPNPKTITILRNRIEEDPDYYPSIPWSSLSSNTSDEAIQFLKENYDNIDWKILSDNTNTKAIKLLDEMEIRNSEHLDWNSIFGNKSAENIIVNRVFKNPRRHYEIRWATLARNTNERVIKILKWKLGWDPDNISWFELSANPSAIQILLDNPDKIVWSKFSHNTKINDPRAIKLLKKKIEEEKGVVKVSGGNYLDWSILSANPSIFELR